MEYHKLHNVKMFVLSEVVEEIVSANPPTDEQKDQIWVNDNANKMCEFVMKHKFKLYHQTVMHNLSRTVHILASIETVLLFTSIF